MDEPLKRCPRANWYWQNLATGDRSPGRCAASSCPYCGPFEARLRARAVTDGGTTGPPQRLVTLTLPRERWAMEWQTLRQKMKDYRRVLKREHGEWEHAWAVERGDQNGALHIHALQKGSYVPQAELQRRWGGIVDIRAIKGDPTAAAGYPIKEAMRVAGYALKGADDSLTRHLELNGGRFMHWSRGYFGDETFQDVRKRLQGRSEDDGEPEWERVNGELPEDRYRRRGQMLANLVR